jgi:heat shock protein beta-11
MEKIKTISTNVRKLQFEASTQTSPSEFQEIYEVEVADRNGRVQSETNQLRNKPKARFLRITICSGWDDFASIRRISIEGASS